MIQSSSIRKSSRKTELRRKMRYRKRLSTKPTVHYGSQPLSKSEHKTPGMYGFASSGSTDLMNYPAVVSHITAKGKSSNPPSKTLSLPTRSPGMPMLLIGRKWTTRKTQTVLTDYSGGRLLTRIRVNSAYIPPQLTHSQGLVLNELG